MSKEEIIRMARDAGFGISAFNAIDGYEVVTIDGKIITDEIERFAALVAAAEKEQCAKVCETLRVTHGNGDPDGDECAAAIRALT